MPEFFSPHSHCTLQQAPALSLLPVLPQICHWWTQPMEKQRPLFPKDVHFKLMFVYVPPVPQWQLTKNVQY
jgi:hypothetical protein